MLFATLNRLNVAAQRTHKRTETPPTPTKMDSIQFICWSVRRCVLVSAGFLLISAGFFVSSQGRDGVVGVGWGLFFPPFRQRQAHTITFSVVFVWFSLCSAFSPASFLCEKQQIDVLYDHTFFSACCCRLPYLILTWASPQAYNYFNVGLWYMPCMRTMGDYYLLTGNCEHLEPIGLMRTECC